MSFFDSLKKKMENLSLEDVVATAGKVAGSAIVGTAGLVAERIEDMAAASGSSGGADTAHKAKSACFNAVRSMWGKESKEYDHMTGEQTMRGLANMQQKQAAAIQKMQREGKIPQDLSNHHRKSDAEFAMSTNGIDAQVASFQHMKKVPLKTAIEIADSKPGVYILYLDNQVMKCGRAAYSSGVRWRLRQYYSLNYDDRAREKDYWSISPANRDQIRVSWQCCPESKCKELEAKLFEKYGKGPWGLRAPEVTGEDTWKLLI